MEKTTAEKIKILRDRTGVGVMGCCRVLNECGGDIETAEKMIRDSRTGQVPEISTGGAGIVHSYVHTGDRVGVLVEVSCGTDFAARTDEFKTFVHDLAMHIAAMNPLWISPIEAPWDSGDGDVDDSRYLITQPFIKDGSRTIGDLLVELSERMREPCAIRRFVRWEVGEELPEPKPQQLPKQRGPVVAAAVVLLSIVVLAVGAALCGAC